MNFFYLAAGYVLGSSGDAKTPRPSPVPMTVDDWVIVGCILAVAAVFGLFMARKMMRMIRAGL